MNEKQDITVPQGDNRRVEIPITDVSGPTAGDPTNLQNKTVRWELKRNSRADTPVIEYTDANPKLTIEDALAGRVSLELDSTETREEYDNYRHYFHVEDGDDEWTVATGVLNIQL